MFPTLARLSRTTYQGARGSGAGSSSRTTARSSPKSRNTLGPAIARGQVFKRSQTGLYHLAQLQSGHNVPKSRQKTARTWQPNVQSKMLSSGVLGRMVRVDATAKALRCIRKAGGLDEYVRRTRDEALGVFGRKLRSEMGAVARVRVMEEERKRRAAEMKSRKLATKAAAASAKGKGKDAGKSITGRPNAVASTTTSASKRSGKATLAQTTAARKGPGAPTSTRTTTTTKATLEDKSNKAAIAARATAKVAALSAASRTTKGPEASASA